MSTIEESIRVIKSESPDFVFLDLRMPGHDGFDYLRSIRQSLVDSPICVAVTGDATAEMQGKCKEAGFDAFIAKPIRTQRVLTVLNDLQGSTT